MLGSIPGSAKDCQREMGNRLHWTVRPIQPIIPFPVVILWPNRVDSAQNFSKNKTSSMTWWVNLYQTQTGGSWNCRGQLVEDGAADINCRLLATGKFCVDIFARMHAAARWYPHSPCRDWRKDALSLLACKNSYYATFWCIKAGPSTINN